MAPTPSDAAPQSVFVIPALDAESTIEQVVRSLFDFGDSPTRVIVVDDGSRDATARNATQAGAEVVRHRSNRGKGAALWSGFSAARAGGASAVVTLDADGQHAARDAWLLARHPAPVDTLLLGIRNMRQAGAPKANQYSNRFSNLVLSAFSGAELWDTQCGLRRYPLERTLASGARASGFAFESELLLMAALRGWPIEQLPVGVHYPAEELRTTHFHNVRDPAKIVVSVVSTVVRERTRSILRLGRHSG